MAEQDRYARQSRFAGLGPVGQERLRAARVLVLGCGGLGAAAANLLARAGVGRLVLVDRDVVEVVNLHRQLLYDEADAAARLPKAAAAARAIARLNSEVAVEPLQLDVGAGSIGPLIAGVDVVIDGTDNLETRYLLNDASLQLGVPWVYGGAVAATGMSMAIVPWTTACFRCLYPRRPPPGTMATCVTAGVLGGAVVAVAALQVTAAMKLLVGDRAGAGELTAFDVWTGEHEHTVVPRRPDCPSCGARAASQASARIPGASRPVDATYSS